MPNPVISVFGLRIGTVKREIVDGQPVVEVVSPVRQTFKWGKHGIMYAQCPTCTPPTPEMLAAYPVGSPEFNTLIPGTPCRNSEYGCGIYSANHQGYVMPLLEHYLEQPEHMVFLTACHGKIEPRERGQKSSANVVLGILRIPDRHASYASQHHVSGWNWNNRYGAAYLDAIAAFDEIGVRLREIEEEDALFVTEARLFQAFPELFLIEGNPTHNKMAEPTAKFRMAPSTAHRLKLDYEPVAIEGEWASLFKKGA